MRRPAISGPGAALALCLLVLHPSPCVACGGPAADSAGATAHAIPGSPEATGGALGQLLAEADLVFVGTVREIGYARSKGTPGLPHTFVRYRVERVYNGVPPEHGLLTLRFLGGPSDDDRYLVLPHHPTFDVGDRDLLFVAGNGERECPLVECKRGRIRLIDDEAYSDEGREIVREGGDIALGPPRELEAVRTWKIGDARFESGPSEHAPEPPPFDQDPRMHLGAVGLGQMIEARLASGDAAFAGRSLVASADPDQPFVHTGAAPAPPAAPGPNAAPELDDELKALLENDGNPVLPTPAPAPPSP